MRPRSLCYLIACLALIGVGGGAGRAGAVALGHRADAASVKPLYRYGQDGRYLLGGSWRFRFDRGQGMRQRYFSAPSTRGWRVVSVPNAWNATDESTAGDRGTVGWYRKDFRLPGGGSGASWIVRFESVNLHSRVWLNGHEIGAHNDVFLPFEFELPRNLLKAGANRLVIRIDSRRRETDFPPAALKRDGTPGGGWWNYGGILREVYLRRVDRVDIQSAVLLPDVPCPTCPASVSYRVTARNYTRSPQRVHLLARFGTVPVDLGSANVPGAGTHVFGARMALAHPELWYPAHPHLYDVNIDAQANGVHVAHYFLRSGVRSIKVSPDGMLLLNGQVLNMRGVGLQEDSKQFGFAIDNSIRARFISEVHDLGATFIRSQYPLHPYLEELADASGILLWSEIPVYTVRAQYLDRPSLLRHAALQARSNILANASHPSVIIWSIANELSSQPGRSQGTYIARTVRAIKSLDPTRPVGLAYAGNPAAGCQAASYAPLDLLGINDYFGWYTGIKAGIADRDLLGDYLDFARTCYPHKALLVSEFGAEANRPGPVEERGSYAFQQDFVNFNLGAFDARPWLAGAAYWALEEFRVHPGWDGGNPRPAPPIHTKGLISFTGFRKPAFYDAQRIFAATPQLRPR